jgi:hypothetical protein
VEFVLKHISKYLTAFIFLFTLVIAFSINPSNLLASPNLNVQNPVDVLQTSSNNVTVNGTVNIGGTITVNKVAVAVDSTGNFTQNVHLKEGTNTINILAQDSSGSTSVTRTVTYNKPSPVLNITSPIDNFQTTNNTANITGQISNGSMVTINGVALSLDAQGNFSQTVSLEVGTNSFEIIGYNNDAGTSTLLTKTITRNNVPGPVLIIDGGPADNSMVYDEWVMFGGWAPYGSTVLVNGLPTAWINTYDDPSEWSVGVHLQPGKNTLTFTCNDGIGTTTITRTVIYPVAMITSLPILTYNATTQQTITLTGKAPTNSTVTINGTQVTVDSNGTFSMGVTLNEGRNAFSVVGTDATGFSTTINVSITRDNTLPTLSVQNPTDNLVTGSNSIIVYGNATDDDPYFTVKVNGSPVIWEYDYETGDCLGFHKSVTLQPGSNIITITATDTAGNVTTVTLTVYRQ